MLISNCPVQAVGVSLLRNPRCQKQRSCHCLICSCLLDWVRYDALHSYIATLLQLSIEPSSLRPNLFVITFACIPKRTLTDKRLFWTYIFSTQRRHQNLHGSYDRRVKSWAISKGPEIVVITDDHTFFKVFASSPMAETILLNQVEIAWVACKREKSPGSVHQEVSGYYIIQHRPSRSQR